MTINRLLYISIIVIMMIPHAVSAEEFLNTPKSPRQIEFKERIDINKRLDSMVHAEVSRQVNENVIGLKIESACKDIENACKDKISDEIDKRVSRIIKIFAIIISAILGIIGWLLSSRIKTKVEETFEKRIVTIENDFNSFKTQNANLMTENGKLNKTKDELYAELWKSGKGESAFNVKNR